MEVGGGGKLVTLMLPAAAAIEAAIEAAEIWLPPPPTPPLLPAPLPLLPMAIAAAAMEDLLTHFSMWPFNTSRRLNFRPQSEQG